MTGRVAAIGDEPRVAGWALAGVLVAPASTPEQVRAAWAELPADVDLVLLTAGAAAALAAELAGRPDRLTAVLPG